MRQIKICLIFFLLQFAAAKTFALPWQDSPEIEKIFSDAKITGTFVVYDVTANRLIGFNPQRANTRYVPASTFKIPNTLIALATGTVKNTDENQAYGGGSYEIKAWEQDMSLREAIKVSNVPIYQGVARRVGIERMQQYIQLLHYGNMQLGDQIDKFWLKGPLEISAIEQTIFLAQLAQGMLPVDHKVQEEVREITLLESRTNWELHGKTGWYSRESGPGIGWYVGWVLKDGHIYAFALNLDGEFNKQNLENRVIFSKASLCALELYPCN